jgi:ASC-1-like (ASCH) protein
MYKNEKGQFIGRGEDTALVILKSEFPEAEFKTQVPFKDLLNDEWIETVTERQEKETIDILITKGDKNVAIRVQDKRHNGIGLAQRDIVQKKTLEWNNCIVVDLIEQECPILFKDMLNDESIKEVRSALSIYKVLNL